MAKINLGCGYRKMDSCINVDNREVVKPDIVVDVEQGLPFLDNSIDEVMAIDFLEHIERSRLFPLMDEIWRVLKPRGKFNHVTPSDSGRGAWQDPTHKAAWNINTWKFYFTDLAYRKLYSTKANFKILYLEDKITDHANRVVHTHCGYEAIK